VTYNMKLPPWASKRSATPFIFAIDDSGQKAIRPSSRAHSFLFGGVVLPAARMEDLHRNWSEISGDMPEVKKQTYSKGLGISGSNPHWLEAVLSVQMEYWDALPFFLSFNKAEVGNELTRATRKGQRRVDLAEAVPALIATISAFLTANGGRAEIRIDRMASLAEEGEIQQAWCRQRATLSANSRRRLPEQVDFVDSQSNPEVQVADVLMGFFRDAHENGRGLVPGLARLIRKAESRTLFGFHLS